ncbi:MAG: saccharopine dehydrogenase NADP-binding domain-containing protein [Chlamydiales bacterium]|nr:saccharopine dehydrogenase NADP-binding domain-containing protein [Chlamydiales bacterium]
MTDYVKLARLPGRLVMVGFGSVGQGVLPLLLRHIELQKEDITIVTADDRGKAVAEEFGVTHIQQVLTMDNYRQILTPLIHANDLVINLAVDVSSTALIQLCHERGALYFDTCIEPWEGGYTDPHLTASQRSNYGLRESALALRSKYPNGPTAVLAHGANPGLVSHLVKKALLTVATDINGKVDKPSDRDGWAKLAMDLGVKVIHIAERDTQVANAHKKVGEFVNTWSVDGFIGEGSQPSELGWGSHEKHWPSDASRHEFGCQSAIYLNRPGASVRVRTWTPNEGPFHSFLITHNESISISDYLTVHSDNGATYRPTVHYAYHPCDEAVISVHELAGKNWHSQKSKRVMMDEIVNGMDELGVLLMGHDKGAYWFGSQLTIEEARRLAPHNSATTLQITVSVLAGVAWALKNPQRGIVESDEMDYEDIIEMASPYLGRLVGKYTDWTPLEGRGLLFPEDLDFEDPWQFKNFRVL